jgi:Lrp/AsnC family transcriptional regulator for asnA, asnC and gidA
MSKIDEIDRQIVNLLMDDGRMPASQIASRIGEVSERVVRYRIERLVREGMISISAVPHPRAFGFNVIADVFIEVEPDHIDEVASKLAKYDFVSYVACSIGERDVSIQIVARDNAEVYNIATQVIGSLPGVRKTTTSIVPIVMKDVYQWRVPERALPENEKGSPPSSPG